MNHFVAGCFFWPMEESNLLEFFAKNDGRVDVNPRFPGIMKWDPFLGKDRTSWPYCRDIVRHFMWFLTLLASSVEQHVPLSKLYPKRNLLQLKQFMSPLKFGKCIIFHQTSHRSQESYTAYASPMPSFPLSRKFIRPSFCHHYLRFPWN